MDTASLHVFAAFESIVLPVLILVLFAWRLSCMRREWMAKTEEDGGSEDPKSLPEVAQNAYAPTDDEEDV